VLDAATIKLRKKLVAIDSIKKDLIMNIIKKMVNKIKRMRHLKVKGRNNFISPIPNRLRITIYGDNNKVILDDCPLFEGAIIIGTSDCPIQNCVVEIGEKSTSEGIYMMLLENNSKIKIGKDCMFSSGVDIYCTDTHSVLNADNEVINVGKFIELGDHVWCGKNVKIGKNTKIADNSIIGWGSVVTRAFEKTNVLIAGNPAQIVKENINWDRARPTKYLISGKEKTGVNQ